MVGHPGTDCTCEPWLETPAYEAIDVRCIIRGPDAGTGVSSPLVHAGGSNSIVFVPRANLSLTSSQVEAAAAALTATDAVLLQLETPIDASLRSAQKAREAGGHVVWNPAPACSIPDPLWTLCDILVPNEVEAATLSGCTSDAPLGAASSSHSCRPWRTACSSRHAPGQAAVFSSRGEGER